MTTTKFLLRFVFLALWLFLWLPLAHTQSNDIMVGPSLTEGYGMGVNSSGGRTDWLAAEDDSMSMAYPSGQQWGAVFITVGDPSDPPHPSQDFSLFKSLSVELRGLNGGETLAVGIKSNNQPDNGRETKLPVSPTSEWVTYTFPLNKFTGANLKKLYVVLEFVFSGMKSQTVSFRNVKYIGIEAARQSTIPVSNPPIPDQAIAGNVSQGWRDKVAKIRWVAFSPTVSNPTKGIEPTPDSIRADLAVLRKAGFTGLVTYSSKGVLGRELPAIAESLGFQGIISGVWNPTDADELKAAQSQAKSTILMGYGVGNEGLDKRYKWPELAKVMNNLRQATNKPVTTTEEFDDYQQTDLLTGADWIFPNAHPYFQGKLDPESAVRWTSAAFEDLSRRSQGRFVFFREVGLPTQGNGKEKLSEANQASYYNLLATTKVRFVFFEAFDQTWKSHLPVEPHWGLFYADRSPKLFARHLMGQPEPISATKPSPASKPKPAVVNLPDAGKEDFFIYQDAGSPKNHYLPSGFMGDTGDVRLDENYDKNPHSGKTAIRVEYTAQGMGPSVCNYGPNCKWAGVYWQQPANNWGTQAAFKGQGFNLSGYKRLRFWARAEKATTIEFKVGGVNEQFGDSLAFPRTIIAPLTSTWGEFTIELIDADLQHLIGGFCFTAKQETNPSGVVFFLDDIRFEK